jgi:hypothetical protein
MDTKTCNLCGILKCETEFYKTYNKNGIKRPNAKCKQCELEINKKWMNENKEYRKQYCSEYRKNPENRKRRNDGVRKWRNENREHVKNYKRNAYHSNIQAKLKNKYTSSVRHFILNGLEKRVSFASKTVGCTRDEFRSHIENLFQEGMTWINHGNDGWEFDHIIPINSFDLTDPEQVLKCYNYKNYQPLWRSQNMEKGATNDNA